MNIIIENELEKLYLPGRIIQKSVGSDGASRSKKMTMGFATYCESCGKMEPHHHAEEIVYILSSDKGYFRYGETVDMLCDRIKLDSGMTIHFKELEWHVFEYDEGGSVEIIYFYGQVDNIRPEEILNK
jgi:hypothetical protein